MSNIDKQDILNHTTIVSVASRYAEVKRLGKEWVTLCPWHTDTKPSLTIFTGKHGYEHCYCHACGSGGNVIDLYMQQTASTYPEALAALGNGQLLGASDKPMVASSKPIKPADWMATKPPANNIPSFTHYELGEAKGVWAYRDANGEPLYYECRYETVDDDGEITKHPRCLTWGRLSAHTPYKWSARHWPSPRPLYGLDYVAKLPSSASIVVFEGPRKAELAQSLLKSPCVAWAAGANSWMQADWSIAAGRKIILFPDNDDKGINAMKLLAKSLIAKGAKVEIVIIPADKPEKWDICDDKSLTADTLKAYIKNREPYKMAKTTIKLDISKIRDDIEIQDTEAVPPVAHTAPTLAATDGIIKDSFKPLMHQTTGTQEWPDPEDLTKDVLSVQIKREHLPELFADLPFLKAGPNGGDPGAIAMSMLASTASAIHDGIKLYPDRNGNWAESARIWVALVGGPSAKKTFCADFGAAPIKKADKDALEKSDNAKRLYRLQFKKYEAILNEWLETDQSTPMPISPKHPEVPRYYMGNTTIEAFQEAAQFNPRGTLVFYDELSGWLSMGQYKNGGGSDRAEWLMAYNGGSQRIDRISRGSFIIENFSACVVGGIQPETIAKISRNIQDDGLLQRFYISYVPAAEPGDPPTSEQKAAIERLELEYSNLMAHLLATKPDGTRVEMSPEARATTLTEFRKFHALARHNAYGTKCSAAIAKFEGGMHRMCLIYHAIECYKKGKHPADLEVSNATAERVCALYREYILPNLVTFYSDVLGEGLTIFRNVRMAADYILRSSSQYITTSLLRNFAGLKDLTQAERKEVLGHLSEAGWLLPADLYRDAVTNQPKRWDINPQVHVKFQSRAIREKLANDAKLASMHACGYGEAAQRELDAGTYARAAV